MRLFIAIPLSPEMQKALVACMHDLKKQGVEGNYVPAANLHMTLAFIGEYDDPKKVKQVIEKVPVPKFRLALSEKGNFGHPLGRGKREPEAERVCEGAAGRVEGRRDSL